MKKLLAPFACALVVVLVLAVPSSATYIPPNTGTPGEPSQTSSSTVQQIDQALTTSVSLTGTGTLWNGCNGTLSGSLPITGGFQSVWLTMPGANNPGQNKIQMQTDTDCSFPNGGTPVGTGQQISGQSQPFDAIVATGPGVYVWALPAGPSRLQVVSGSGAISGASVALKFAPVPASIQTEPNQTYATGTTTGVSVTTTSAQLVPAVTGIRQHIRVILNTNSWMGCNPGAAAVDGANLWELRGVGAHFDAALPGSASRDAINCKQNAAAGTAAVASYTIQ